MADFTIKAHDDYPSLEAVLSDATGPVDLTGASVRLLLKTSTGGTTVGGICTIVNAPGGVVRYDWDALVDTANVNTFNGEFEVTWSDGKVTTFPNDSYFTVEVKADLG